MHAGKLGAGGRRHRSHHHVEERIGVRPQMQAGIVKLPAVVTEIDRLVGGEQLHDYAQAIFEQLTGL